VSIPVIDPPEAAGSASIHFRRGVTGGATKTALADLDLPLRRNQRPNALKSHLHVRRAVSPVLIPSLELKGARWRS